MKKQNDEFGIYKRKLFYIYLLQMLQFVNPQVIDIKIDWDETDVHFRESHKTVTIIYIGGYELVINTNMNSFKATAWSVIKEC